MLSADKMTSKVEKIHENFIYVECVSITLMSAFQPPGIYPTKLDAPQPDGFIADDYAALCRQIFNIPVAEIEAKVKPDCITDDIGWKPVTLVCIHTGIIHFRELSCQYLKISCSVISPIYIF